MNELFQTCYRDGVYYCVFDVEQMRPLVEHSRKSEKHRGTYGQPEAVPGLLFVHDQGVYLMSNGDPGLLLPGEAIRHQVVYALEMSPDDSDCWENAEAAVGGDDFVEVIELSIILPSIEAGMKQFVIRADEENLHMFFLG